jgi:4-cresol dehydrogenase (hydroxylating)
MTIWPPLKEFGLYNYRGGEVLKQLALARAVLEEYGFDHIAGFQMSGRHMEHLVDLLFDRTNPEKAKRLRLFQQAF